jgi:hypothetical protein
MEINKNWSRENERKKNQIMKKKKEYFFMEESGVGLMGLPGV